MSESKSLGFTLGKLSLQENDIVVIKFDHYKWKSDMIGKFMSAAKDICPNPIIAIPDGMDISADYVDNVIEYLQQMKKS